MGVARFIKRPAGIYLVSLLFLVVAKLFFMDSEALYQMKPEVQSAVGPGGAPALWVVWFPPLFFAGGILGIVMAVAMFLRTRWARIAGVVYSGLVLLLFVGWLASNSPGIRLLTAILEGALVVILLILTLNKATVAAFKKAPAPPENPQTPR